MNEKKRVIVLDELAAEGVEVLRGAGLEVDDGAGWDCLLYTSDAADE